MTYAEFKFRYQLTNAQISMMFGIPQRTVESWSAGTRKPPDYVIDMMVTIMQLNK